MPDINLGWDRLPPDDGEERADPQPAIPQSPPTWGAGDQSRYDKVQAGISQVETDADAGEIHPIHAHAALMDLLPKKAALDQKRVAASAAAQQMAQHQAMHANAFQASLSQADAQHDAENFHGRTAVYTDPITGQTAHYFQKEHGKWEQTHFGNSPQANQPDEADRPVDLQQSSQEPPKIEAGPVGGDGKQRLTIWNGSNRDEYEYDHNGKNARPVDTNRQAPSQVPGKDPIRAEAERQYGRPEPLQFIGRDRHGNPVTNPAWLHYDTGIRTIQNRLITADAAQRRAGAAQVETDYRDALKNHPLKDYQDAADPHAARDRAIMSDFGALHPNDSRVSASKARAASTAAALATKDPDKMSLGQLAAATLGPHANMQTMIQKAEDEVRKDARVIPPDTDRGDVIYNPSSGAKTGVWQDMHPEGIHAEAQNRVRARLKGMLMDTRKATDAAPATPGAPAASSVKPPPPLDPSKWTKAEIDAKLAEKLAAQKPKGPAFTPGDMPQ